MNNLVVHPDVMSLLLWRSLCAPTTKIGTVISMYAMICNRVEFTQVKVYNYAPIQFAASATGVFRHYNWLAKITFKIYWANIPDSSLTVLKFLDAVYQHSPNEEQLYKQSTIFAGK